MSKLENQTIIYKRRRVELNSLPLKIREKLVNSFNRINKIKNEENDTKDESSEQNRSEGGGQPTNGPKPSKTKSSKAKGREKEKGCENC